MIGLYRSRITRAIDRCFACVADINGRIAASLGAVPTAADGSAIQRLDTNSGASAMAASQASMST